MWSQRQLQEAEAKYRSAHAEGRRLLRDEVTADDVAGVVAVWTGIPLTRLKQSEKEKLLNLKDTLHQRIVAQDKAVRPKHADVKLHACKQTGRHACSPTILRMHACVHAGVGCGRGDSAVSRGFE